MSIKCLRCGNCCPKDCEYLKRETDGHYTCTIYVSGRTRIDKHGKHLDICDLKPLKLWCEGIACLAIMGPSADPTNLTVQPNGQVKRR